MEKIATTSRHIKSCNDFIITTWYASIDLSQKYGICQTYSGNFKYLKYSGYIIVLVLQAIYFDIFQDDTYFNGCASKIPLKR